ncbi:nucleotidyltransferase domain-containing protein [Allisonella histaminiformans]|uniref:nucleotidyltransferase domain-containing protein n=1 Tax=Allisonella histaminiformans TaxID=209880 RepID=UPI00307BBC45
MEMEARIKEELNKIEAAEGVRIIWSAESGSRAWGFASPDSDYDVRFIYVRNKVDYLRLDKVRDVIEWRLDDVLDISGWDIRKALELLYKSNPTLFEWCASPIIYKETEEAQWLKDMLPQYFSMKKSLYHYLSMAKSNYHKYLQGEEVRLKKYFYVLRPILAAQWILDKKCAPPMQFATLVDTELEEAMKPQVSRLLAMKKNTPEMGTAPKIEEINRYIDRKLEEIQSAAEALDNTEAEWDALNELFLRMLAGR